MSDAAVPALPRLSLDALRDQGCDRFDPAGWHYLELLAQRAATHEGSVRRMLEAKLALAAKSFSDRFAHARRGAAELLAAACERHPLASAELQRLFANNDFKSLRRQRDMLDAREQCASLTELVTQFEPSTANIPAHRAISRVEPAASPTLELKTVRESRATWARMSVDKQLSEAMKQAPKNAGPINSHMLVLRSLALMQAIAPDYLSRVVSYVDTLLLLDPGEKDVPVKRKKAAPAKTGKTTKLKK